MSESTEGSFELIQSKLKVEGNSAEIIYSNLVINQALADVNTFAFVWRQEEGEPTMAAHVDFYKKYLSKEVTISIKDFSFKGFISAINCLRQDELGVDYEIMGTGLFGKLDEVPECNSFIKKSLDQIFKDVNKSQGTKLKLEPKHTKELFYTVQYNQTTFDFYKMLAARYGEWLYYTGTELVLGPPSGSAVSLKFDIDVLDVSIKARSRKATSLGVGYDHYKGQVTESPHAKGSFGSGLLSATTAAGDTSFGSSHAAAFYSNAANSAMLKEMSLLQQKAAAASSVTIAGTTHNSNLTPGKKLKLLNRRNGNEGEYIITEVRHRSESPSNYENYFVAIPAEIEVPPYTDPLQFTVCRSQPAVVVDNEDADGLDRIKVRFPWMQSGESTPWINVMTPYAGKNKGFRFLPEVGEEVQVDFVDNNAERPFMVGAIYTEKDKSGTAHKGNHLKTIGSRSGRRLEMDDNEGWLKLVDNHSGGKQVNGITMRKSKNDQFLTLASFKDDDNFFAVSFNKENSDLLEISVSDGGSKVAEITLDKKKKKIIIKSMDSIELTADKKISLSAPEISISANQELKMEGKTKGVDISGMKVAMEATSSMAVKGINTKVEGSAKLELSSAALASMEAALVKIN